MAWISVKDYAEMTGKSRQAVLKAIAKGKLKVQQIEAPGARGLVYEVWADNQELTTADNHDNHDNHELDSRLRGNDRGVALECYDTGRGNACTGILGGKRELKAGSDVAVMVGDGLELRDFGLADVPIINPVTLELPPKQDKQAKLRAVMLMEWETYKTGMSAQSPGRSVAELKEKFVGMYNHGLVCAELYEIDGDISVRTLSRREQEYKLAKRDYRVLANHYAPKSKSKALQDDVDWVCNLLFTDRSISIGAALSKWEWIRYKKHGACPPVSERTMRRAVERAIARDKAAWELRQKGEKWFSENRLPTLLMDNDVFSVMDQWQTDGKLMNLFVRNPFTGKDVRPHLCCFIDTASTMPVGMSIDWTENSMMIQEAYLNGIMFTKTVPKLIKSDNGSGFKSESTLGDKEIDELKGIYYRSGVIDVQFHRPYNAKGKAPIERMFGTFTGQFEAFLRSYTGRSAMTKPAHTQRNEKWIQKLENRQALEVSELKAALEAYILGEYANQKHPRIAGKTRAQVYAEGMAQIDVGRHVNPDSYLYLLRSDLKKVGNNGITHKGALYYDPKLIDYVKETVKVRFGMLEDRYILVYSQNEDFICQATARVLTHPAAKHAGEAEQGIVKHQVKAVKQAMGRYKKSVIELQKQYDANPVMLEQADTAQISQSSYLDLGAKREIEQQRALENDPIKKALKGVEYAQQEANPLKIDFDALDGAEDAEADADKIDLKTILG